MLTTTLTRLKARLLAGLVLLASLVASVALFPGAANATTSLAYCGHATGSYGVDAYACGTTYYTVLGSNSFRIDGIQLCVRNYHDPSNGNLRQSKSNYGVIYGSNGALKWSGNFPNVADTACTYKAVGVQVGYGASITLTGIFDIFGQGDKGWRVCNPVIAGYPTSTAC